VGSLSLVTSSAQADRVNREASLKGTSTRIVLIDDQDLFRDSLSLGLSEAGFEVHAFASGEAGIAHLSTDPGADVVLLDWMMPGMNGVEVLRRIRAASLTVPVIFLTALSDQIYEETALQWGAVDFIEKSRSFSILRRRIELILQGAKPRPADGAASSPDGAIFRRGALELRRDTARAFWKEQEIPLTVSEFKMIDLLATQAGTDVRYRELYDLVHGEGFITGTGSEGYRANVRAFVKRIREKFRAVDSEWDGLENHFGFGYRWRDHAANS
jgi:two-component system, OmpR family, response regulator ChvI